MTGYRLKNDFPALPPQPGMPVDKTPRPFTLTLACKRYPVAKLKDLIPIKFLEALEQNQQIATCCRHPEEHDIEAFRSHPREYAPDIYVLHCKCGRKHRRFIVGGGDERPYWEVG
jgi:hypothetical protein